MGNYWTYCYCKHVDKHIVHLRYDCQKHYGVKSEQNKAGVNLTYTYLVHIAGKPEVHRAYKEHNYQQSEIQHLR